ncbi:MAG: transposase [Gemmataceae bacterium]
MSAPVAYFITFTTYGTWLHGRNPGSVDREHNTPGTPFLPGDENRELESQSRLGQPPYALDEPHRNVVMRTIVAVCAHRKWKLWAVHVRSNHVHVVVTADCNPEKVMVDLKAWASRRLRKVFSEPADRDRWTQHGSTRYLNSISDLEAKVIYVLDEQGERMAHFDGRVINEPEA